jgi:hypothetical protein
MNPTLHRYATFLVVLAVAVIVAGAVITSTEVAARQTQSAVSPDVHESLHRILAIALTLGGLGLAIGITRTAAAAWLRAV